MSITITAAIQVDGWLDLTSKPDVPQVNMAGGNAATILNLLGLDIDDDEVPAEDFLGRVLLAQALLSTTTDDEGRPAITDGRWTTCGQRPGYLAGRLAELWEVATWAREHNAAVTWG